MNNEIKSALAQALTEAVTEVVDKMTSSLANSLQIDKTEETFEVTIKDIGRDENNNHQILVKFFDSLSYQYLITYNHNIYTNSTDIISFRKSYQNEYIQDIDWLELENWLTEAGKKTLLENEIVQDAIATLHGISDKEVYDIIEDIGMQNVTWNDCEAAGNELSRLLEEATGEKWNNWGESIECDETLLTKFSRDFNVAIEDVDMRDADGDYISKCIPVRTDDLKELKRMADKYRLDIVGVKIQDDEDEWQFTEECNGYRHNQGATFTKRDIYKFKNRRLTEYSEGDWDYDMAFVEQGYDIDYADKMKFR